MPPAAANSYANVNMYGYPLIFGQGGSPGMGIPGGAYTVTDPGIQGLSDVTARYGIISGSSASVSPTAYSGYVGPALNGVQLGVSFGYPLASRDAATTAYAKDLAYEADLDNAFIAFPGLGVGSAGVAFPTLNSNKASVKYAESVRFQLSTESDTMPVSGFYMPLGLGLGYTSVGLPGSTGMAYGGLGMPFYFGTT